MRGGGGRRPNCREGAVQREGGGSGEHLALRRRRCQGSVASGTRLGWVLGCCRPADVGAPPPPPMLLCSRKKIGGKGESRGRKGGRCTGARWWRASQQGRLPLD